MTNAADAIRPKLRTGEALVQAGVVNRAQLEIALQEQRARRGDAYLPIAELLIRSRFCTREAAEHVISNNDFGSVGSMLGTVLPQSTCTRYQVLPDRIVNGTLIIKAVAPLTSSQKKAVTAACLVPVSGIKVRAISRRAYVQESVRLFTASYVLADCLDELKSQEPTGALVQRTIAALLKEALDLRASDIHLDYKSDYDSWISWRVDGVLQYRYLVPKKVMGPLIIRLKTDAGMDASESRRDQDGRIHYQYSGRVLDFRVSTLPLVGGESLTLRVLDAEGLPSLEQLFPGQPELTAQLRGHLAVREKRGGLILVSGQTGSGKSTTLNVLARELPRERVNLITVEDPVELELPFARQFQKNALINQTMAQTERALLRQDPDVILIGEIRDADSALTALKLAESGHLVFSTVHAEDPLQAILRVVSVVSEQESRDWATFVLSQFLKVSINQALLPAPCPACSTVTVGGLAHNPDGCPFCVGGYRGRILVHDSLFLSPATSDHIRDEMQQALRTGGLHGLRKLEASPGVIRVKRTAVARTLVRENKLAIADLNRLERESPEEVNSTVTERQAYE